MKIFKNIYFRMTLAIAFYLVVMHLVGPYLIVPLFKQIFQINFFDNVATINHDQFAYFFKFYRTNINIINALLQATIYGIEIFGLVIICYHELAEDHESYQENEATILNAIGKGVLVYFGLTILANLIVQALSIIANSNPSSMNQANIEELFKTPLATKLLMVITTVIIGPLVEELIYRKAIWKLIRIKPLALVLSSIIFGLVHTLSFGYNFMDLLIVTIPYVAAGLAFGYVYYKTDNILASYMLHAGLNLLSVLFILFM